jgi:hypothetical protein
VDASVATAFDFTLKLRLSFLNGLDLNGACGPTGKDTFEMLNLRGHMLLFVFRLLASVPYIVKPLQRASYGGILYLQCG